MALLDDLGSIITPAGDPSSHPTRVRALMPQGRRRYRPRPGGQLNNVMGTILPVNPDDDTIFFARLERQLAVKLAVVIDPKIAGVNAVGTNLLDDNRIVQRQSVASEYDRRDDREPENHSELTVYRRVQHSQGGPSLCGSGLVQHRQIGCLIG